MNDKYYEIIEQFIDDELEGEQLLWFQKQLRENKHFVDQYKLQLEVQEALKEDDVMRFRQKLDKIYSESFGKKNTNYKFSKPKILWMAASITLLVIGGVGLHHHLSKPNLSNTELYNQFYKPYETFTWVRSTDTEDIDMIGQALENYENQNYKKAYELLLKVVRTDETNLIVNFYGAIAGMEIGHHQESIKLLKKVVEQGQSLIYQQAKWYLGLCYLKTGQNQEAKLVFLSLGQESTYYKAKVKEILKQM